jgi:2-methylcitrate dehydratase
MFFRDRLAALVHGIRYDELPPEVIREVKRITLDTLACALGAQHGAPARMVRTVAHELGGAPRCTLIAASEKTSCALATLVNGTLMRYLDGNDYYFGRDSAHPSGNLAPALAVAEHAQRGGRALIEAMVAAYEVQLRLCDLTGISEIGWHPGTHVQFAVAALAARLLVNDPGITANAIAIAASHNNTLAQSQRGNIPMMKATAEAMVAKGAVEAALLAAQGLTGPEEIFEGAAGWNKVVAGELDIHALTAPCHDRYRVMEACMKPYSAVAGAMAPIQAAIDLVAGNRRVFTVGDIEAVTIHLPAQAEKKAIGDPKKLAPRDKETADHSFHYCVAVSLLDGACGEAQFSESRIVSDDIRQLIAHTTVVTDDALTALYPGSSGGAVTLQLQGGAQVSKRHDYPPGHPRNRASDAAIERKFYEMADGVLPRAAAQRVIESVWRLDGYADVREFAKSLAL